MTEMVNGFSQDQGASAPVESSVPASSSVSTQTQQAEEKVFRQSEVNEIVKKAKYGAVEDYKRLATERPEYVREKYSAPESSQVNATSHEERIRQLAAEEAQKHLERIRNEESQRSEAERASNLVSSFYTKIAAGKEKYQDFDSVTGDVDLVRFPNVVQLLAGYVDNADDVYYELGKDRIKMANLDFLADKSPNDAIKQIRRLSESIKQNQEAAKVKMPNAPLSTMRPSNTGTDNGAMSVSDYRKRYKV